MLRLWTLLLCLVASPAWATLPTLPTEFDPGTTPALANTKYVCATVNISGATNANPSVLTTSATFYGVTGQSLVIASVGGNTGVNGTRTITRIDSTHFSVPVDTSAGSAYTSGGTVACIDGAVNNATALQSAIDALVSTGGTICLNEAEPYIAPSAGAADTYSNGFILRTKSSTNYTVIRTCDYGTGNRPAEGERVLRKHQASQAKIQAGTTNQANQQTSITCEKAAHYYWIKDIEFTLPSGQMAGSQTSMHIGCAHQWAAASGIPPKKPISNITVVGSTVTVTTSVINVNGHRLWTGKDVTVVCNSSCGVTGINGNTYTVTRTGANTLTFTQAGTSGTYSGSGHYLKESTAMFPDHLVIDQIFMETTDFRHGGDAAPHLKISGVTLFGTNQAVINSHIDIVGGPSCEQGVPITAQTGAQIVRVQNNFLSGSGMALFFGGSSWINGYHPAHWVIRKNTITRRMGGLANAQDASSNLNNIAVCYKNLIETKGAQYVLIEGNDISNGWPDRQRTMFHWTNLQDQGIDADCGASTPALNEGCYPEITNSDLTFQNNRMVLAGDNCFDIIAQHGQTNLFYGTTQGARFLITNNLFIGCGGYERGSSQHSTAITLGGGPTDVTITHNTFIRPVTKAYDSWMRVYCHQPDTAVDAACDQGLGFSELESIATLTGLVVQDNIITSHDTDGVFAVYAAARLTNGCKTTGGWSKVPASGKAWNHNVAVGTMPAACDAINGTTLATGTQVVATEADMNFRGYATHDYCLTASSPGYHAASDGVSNVGVDMQALYSAMGLNYGPGACP